MQNFQAQYFAFSKIAFRLWCYNTIRKIKNDLHISDQNTMSLRYSKTFRN